MSFRSLTRPRHVLTSLALAALIGSTGVLATGAGTESVQHDPFHVPVPLVGDQAVYVTDHRELTYADGTTDRWMDTDVTRFSWQEPVRGPNGTGVVQTMNVLATRHVLIKGENSWDTNATYLLDMDGHVQALAGADTIAYAYERPHYLVPALNSTSSSETDWTYTVFHEMAPYAVACGISNALQGRTFDPTDLEGLVPRACWSGPHPELDHVFRPVGLGLGEDGRRVLELDLVAPRHGVVATYWMEEGTPYPVQIRSGSPDQWSSMSVLVPEAEGTAPIATQADAEPSALTIDVAPRTPWGLDDAGIDHPYPLSRAHQDALEHPEADDLRAYLAAHPSAYLAQASFTSTSTSASHEGLAWYLVWSDGPSSHIAWISLDEQEQEVAGVPVPGTRQTVTSFQSRDDDRVYPLPEMVPDTMPTAASATAWFLAVGEAEHPLGYGFNTDCERTEDDPCVGALVVVTAGWQRFERESTDPMYQFYEDRTAGDEVRLDNERLVGRFASSSAWHNAVSGPVKTSDDPAPAAPDSVPLAASVGAWSWPTAAQAAGIAGASILAGLLYWLWPLLKAGPAALFSRIDKHAVLDHPLRAGIHQAIEARPGIHFQELLRVTGHANGTLDHHLQKLVHADVVKAMKGPGYTCYFDASVGRRAMQAAPALKSEGARKVLATIQGMPGAAPKDVALKAGLSPQTVHYHLHRLREAGLVEEQREGRKVVLTAVA